MALGVSPEKLVFEINAGETETRQIFVTNLSDKPSQIEIRPETPRKEFSISPQNAILAVNETRSVDVSVKSKKSFDTRLEILNLPEPGSELAVATGIKIPVTVRAQAENRDTSLAWPLGLAVLAVAVFYFLKSRFRALT